MKISIVTTMYNSEKFVLEFYQRIINEIKKINFNNYEIIFVDDGSRDYSKNLVIDLKKKDQNIKLIELSKNFGHHNAMFAGLNFSSGDYIFLIDIDLEDQPEWLTLFYEEIKKSSYDVVYGKQKNREGNFARKFFGYVWYKIMSKLLKFNHDDNICTARIMTKKYLNELKRFDEKSYTISALFELTGFKQKSIMVNKTFRKTSNYTFFDKLLLISNFVVSYSNKLLYLTVAINLITSFFALCISAAIVLHKLSNTSLISGWASIIFFVSLFYFFISLSLSIISLYLAEINKETKNRPRYIVKSII